MAGNPEDDITVTMKRRQALGLEKLAELGLSANTAFHLVASPASGEQGLSALRDAMAQTGAPTPPTATRRR